MAGLILGPENVKTVSRCMARQRFTPGDPDKADQGALKKVRCIPGVVEAGGPIGEADLKKPSKKYAMPMMLIIADPHGQMITFRSSCAVKRGESVIQQQLFQGNTEYLFLHIPFVFRVKLKKRARSLPATLI